METKLVEIRDRSTTIIALAVRPGANPLLATAGHPGESDPKCRVCQQKADDIEGERWAWSRAGYGRTYGAQQQYVLLYPIDPDTLSHFADHKPYDPEYGDRTMTTAHRYLQSHWEDVQSGGVVDVRFILGEEPEPAMSDRMFDTVGT